MLYDLNIFWSPSTTQDKLLQTLATAASLGYGTVALNHILELPFPATPVAPFPSLPSSSSSSSSSPSTKLPNILHRATLPLTDPAASNYRLQSLMNAYDLLAIRPVTEQAFQNACLTMDIPIISLDLTQHFPFHFRPKPCMAAVNRGVRFEVCYAQALGADPRGRSNFISNFTSLCRATRGRGIILSSEAKGPLGLRGPADAVNLLSVWGLANEKGMEGLRAVPRSIVVNEGVKRNGFRGIVDIVKTAEKPATGKDEAESRGDTPMSDQSGKGKQKRKPGEDEGQQLSRRQVKKMKLAGRTSGAPKKN